MRFIHEEILCILKHRPIPKYLTIYEMDHIDKSVTKLRIAMVLKIL